MRRRDVLVAPLATLAGAVPQGLRAQGGNAAAWPARPVRLVVAFPPGSAPDTLGRRMAENLTPALGQPVLVENRLGAGGTLGSDLVAKAPPDGYLLNLGGLAAHAIGPAVYRSVPYDPIRDFTHIALCAEFPLALVASAEGPIRSLADLLAAARRSPGAVRVGTPGSGTSSHVTLESLSRVAGVEIVHVPFRGGAAAVVETVAGRIEATFAGVGEFIGNDRLRPLALAAADRLAVWPAAPTFREGGIDLVSMVWFHLCAPAGLPDAIADRLHRETRAALAAPEVAAVLARLGATRDRALTRAETHAFVAAEAARWGDVARAAGVRAE